MATYKFTFSRRAIINEVYEIEANTEEEARDMLDQGWYGDPVDTDYLEWYDDNFELDDTECLDPLVNMIKNYEEKTVDTLEV